jgi:hypothetical protein
MNSENAKRTINETESFQIGLADEESIAGKRFIGEVFDTITYPDGRVEKREQSFNIVVDSVSKLIACLIKNETGYTGGTLYWALGNGSTTWDTTPYSPASTNTKLVSEVFRKSIPSANRYFVDASGNKLGAGVISNRLQLDITIDSGEANGYSLREFGIFGGNATATKDSGIQINHKAHSRIDKVDGMVITRSVRFTF